MVKECQISSIPRYGSNFINFHIQIYIYIYIYIIRNQSITNLVPFVRMQLALKLESHIKEKSMKIKKTTEKLSSRSYVIMNMILRRKCERP